MMMMMMMMIEIRITKAKNIIINRVIMMHLITNTKDCLYGCKYNIKQTIYIDDINKNGVAALLINIFNIKNVFMNAKEI